MKTLVIGCNGQLGQSLVETVPENVDFVGLDLPELDITDDSAVLEACRELSPDLIINAAAYTGVDQAESEPALARSVNVEGPRNIAAAARKINARVIHISTDFVFDGQRSKPYPADAPTNPLNVYGQTKRDGELAVLEGSADSAIIIRTSWLYGENGKNFVKTMLRLMGERDKLGVVVDQFGSPTWADSLAGAVWTFASAPEHSGIFHWADCGDTTWHEFAVAIQEDAISLGLLDKAIPINAIKTADYPAAAQRPPYSVLDCSSTQDAISIQPADWRSNLRKMLNRLAASSECSAD